MNLPNKITLFRVLLIPIFVAVFLNPAIPHHNVIAGGIFILASVTDAIDGYLARKWNLITNFGKLMDPLADKVLVCSALICFVAIPEVKMPVWVVVVIISREFIISGFRLIASDKGVVIAASYWGKFKTTAQMVMSILLIFHFDIPFWFLLERVFVYLSVGLTVISLVDYIWKNKTLMKD